MLDRPNSKDAWLARAADLIPEGRAFIDGAYVGATSGKTFAKTSPIDGRVFAHVADCDAADIDVAVAAARRSFEVMVITTGSVPMIIVGSGPPARWIALASSR